MPTCTFNVDGDDALFVTAIIINPNTGAELPVNAAIDTGACLTSIESSIAKKLELPFQDVTEIVSVGSSRTSNIYAAKVAFQFHEGIRVNLGVFDITDGLNTSVECLIGRDILCCGLLIYNGKDEYFTLSFDSMSD